MEGREGKNKAITEDVKEKKKARTNNRKYSERKDEKTRRKRAHGSLVSKLKCPYGTKAKKSE